MSATAFHGLADMPPATARALEERLREVDDDDFVKFLCSEEGTWWFVTAVPDADAETRARCLRLMKPVGGALLRGFIGGGGS